MAGTTNVTTPSGVPLNGVYQEYMDGACWVLVLAYAHVGGTNPALVPGAVPTSPSGFSHVHLSTLNVTDSEVVQTRWYCSTDAHGRVVHFATASREVAELVVSDTAGVDNPGYLAPADWSSGFTALSGHTANLPAATTHVYSTPSMAGGLPFYKHGSYRFAVQGLSNRWI